MLQQYFELIDIFQGNPAILFKKKRCFSSKLTIIFSIIFQFYLLYVVYQAVYDYKNFKNYAVSDIQYSDGMANKSLQITKNNMIAVKIQNELLMREFENYFDIQLMIQKVNQTTGQKIDYQNLTMEKCVKDHFQNLDMILFQKNKLDQALCIQKDINIDIGAANSDDTIITIQVQNCDYNRIGCFNLSNQAVFNNYTSNFLESQDIDVLFLNTVFQITTAKRPLTQSIERISTNFRPRQNQFKKILLQPQPFLFFQDTRLITLQNEPQKIQGIYYDKSNIQLHQIYQDLGNDDIVLKVEVKGRLIERQLIITYDKISKYIMMIFASTHILLFILDHISKKANANYFNLELIKEKENIKFEYSFLDILNLYNNKCKIYQQVIQKQKLSLDIIHLMNISEYQKSFFDNVISQNSFKILKVLSKKPTDIKQVSQVIFSDEKDAKNICSKQVELRQILPLNLNQKRKFIAQKIDQEENTFEKDQKEIYVQNIDQENFEKDQKKNHLQNLDQENFDKDQQLSKQYFIYKLDNFLMSVSEIDDNIFKNLFDFIIEQQFQEYMAKHLNIKINYDFKQKYELFRQKKKKQKQK